MLTIWKEEMTNPWNLLSREFFLTGPMFSPRPSSTGRLSVPSRSRRVWAAPSPCTASTAERRSSTMAWLWRKRSMKRRLTRKYALNWIVVRATIQSSAFNVLNQRCLVLSKGPAFDFPLQVLTVQDLVDFSPVYRCLHIYTVLVRSTSPVLCTPPVGFCQVMKGCLGFIIIIFFCSPLRDIPAGHTAQSSPLWVDGVKSMNCLSAK